MKLKVCHLCNLSVRSPRSLIRLQGCLECVERLNNTVNNQKRYTKANKEKIALQLKEWRSANQDSIINYRKDYKINFPDRVSDTNRRSKKKNYKNVYANNAKRRAYRIQRLPKWVSAYELKQIESLYSQARRLSQCLGISFHVDHTVPLKGNTVSGLHTLNNLQIIPGQVNLKKWNKFHDQDIVSPHE
jgi:hypothetical protein